MTNVPARAVYIHVPFCLHHCGYCDFALVANRDHLIPQYLQALDNELQAQRRIVGEVVDVDTIFVGGGTPTHLSADTLRTLFSLIQEHFRPTPNAEISVEANPDGLDTERLAVLQANGVNRLSLGVQSHTHRCSGDRDRTTLSAMDSQRQSGSDLRGSGANSCLVAANA